MKTVPYLLIMLLYVQGWPQENSLKSVLRDYVTKKYHQMDRGHWHYARGEYAKAYQVLARKRAPLTEVDKTFLANSILYQRNPSLIQQWLDSAQVDLPTSQRFYSKFPSMTLALEDSTSVRLDKNLFSGVLNAKDSITILLDTGGSGVGIAADLVHKYAMNTDTTISETSELPAFNMLLTKHPVIIPEIRIGNMTLSNIPATYSTDQQELQKYTGPEFDIIMGLETFIGFLGCVRFDWEASTLSFYRTAGDKGDGRPFLFHDSKPFSMYLLAGAWRTTVFDTGSAIDLAPPEIYLDHFTRKEEKTYGGYSYTAYPVPLNIQGKKVFEMTIGDYNDDFHLVLGNLPVDLLLGNNHKLAHFDLVHNRVTFN